MFNSKEIEFMKKLGLVFDFSSLSDDDFIKIEDIVGEFYTQETQNTDKATETILLCESILDRL